MFSYTVMLIDLINLVDCPYFGQHGQHGQQPYAYWSAENIVFVTPLTKICWLDNECASRVPTFECSWKNLNLLL